MSSKNMYQNEEELRDYEYEDIYESKLKRRRKIGILILVVLVLFFIFMFIKIWYSDTEEIIEVTDNEKNILASSKKYYKTNNEELPTSKGECTEVTLEKLLLEGMIEKKNFQNCHGKDTKVKVCKLQDDTNQYTPFLACDEIKTEFSEWKEGKESDLTKDQSDVKFEFLGQVYNEEEKLEDEYYYKDEISYSDQKIKKGSKYYIWNNNKKIYHSGYHTTSPKSNYIYKDSPTTVAKYYKNGQKTYWNNGSYKTTSPGNGYVNKDSAITFNAYRTRTWNTISTPIVTPHKMHICTIKNSSLTIYSSVECTNRLDNYKVEKGNFYTCNGSNKVSSTTKCPPRCTSGILNDNKTSCGRYGAWSGYTATPCNVNSDNCQKITQTSYKWYKYTKQYYPGYYKSTPRTGYYKDSSTQTTAYKWYKLEKVGEIRTKEKIKPNNLATYKGQSNQTTYSKTPSSTTTKKKVKKTKKVKTNNWQNLSRRYVDEEELLRQFRKNKINAKTLEDIETNKEKAKYKIKMYYRSRL